MAEEIRITTEDYRLAEIYETLGKRGLVQASRAGISKHVKLVQKVARGDAPFNQSSIRGRIKTNRGNPEGHVGIKDYKLRFWAGGTTERYTKAGFYRGFELADAFMERTAAATDPLLKRHLEEAVQDALDASGAS